MCAATLIDAHLLYGLRCLGAWSTAVKSTMPAAFMLQEVLNVVAKLLSLAPTTCKYWQV